MRPTVIYINTQAKYQNIVFLTTYCFVFLQKIQPGGLFEVNEATNVLFMILRDCVISENAINLSSASSQNWTPFFYLPANRRYTSGGTKMLVNHNADTINSH